MSDETPELRSLTSEIQVHENVRPDEDADELGRIFDERVEQEAEEAGRQMRLSDLTDSRPPAPTSGEALADYESGFAERVAERQTTSYDKGHASLIELIAHLIKEEDAWYAEEMERQRAFWARFEDDDGISFNVGRSTK